jgi:hypothetical protein
LSHQFAGFAGVVGGGAGALVGGAAGALVGGAAGALVGGAAGAVVGGAAGVVVGAGWAQAARIDAVPRTRIIRKKVQVLNIFPLLPIFDLLYYLASHFNRYLYHISPPPNPIPTGPSITVNRNIVIYGTEFQIRHIIYFGVAFVKKLANNLTFCLKGHKML